MPLGFHVSKDGRDMSVALREDIEWAKRFGVNISAAQIFVTGPQTTGVSLPPSDRISVKRVVDEFNLQLVIHGAYIDNPWGRAIKSINNIKEEMKICSEINAKGVVVHLSKNAANMETLQFVIDALSGSLSDQIKSAVVLYLEINAAKPTENTFETNEKLTRLFDQVERINKNGLQIGLCIDTAHIWSCGFDDREYETVNNWLKLLPKVPTILHLNDSFGKIGDGKDKHASLTLGNIWSDYNVSTGVKQFDDSGLSAILGWAEFNDIITILERDNDGLINDFNLIKQLGYFAN